MTLWSQDRRFGITLSASALNSIIQECARRPNMETGGILAGRYDNSHCLALVTIVTAPPPDSASGHAWFRRGTAGLERLLKKLWTAGDYYLGEWHFHPNAAPTPSLRDIAQMQSIARDPKYACPEPVLVICGGAVRQRSIAAYVVPASGSNVLVPLIH